MLKLNSDDGYIRFEIGGDAVMVDVLLARAEVIAAVKDVPNPDPGNRAYYAAVTPVVARHLKREAVSAYVAAEVVRAVFDKADEYARADGPDADEAEVAAA